MNILWTCIDHLQFSDLHTIAEANNEHNRVGNDCLQMSWKEW